MSVKNAYPEKPEVPYQRTTVSMQDVVEYLRAMDVPKNVRRAAYIFFRVESANGKAGVNNNYAGIQADGSRWPQQFDDLIAATAVTKENTQAHGGGGQRRFVVFNKWQDSVQFTVRNILRRGMYIGGKTSFVSKLEVDSLPQLVTAYKREWVTGQATYTPTLEELKPFLSMYKQAELLFP